VYVPAEVYVWTGSSAVAVLPSPNDQIQDVGVLVDVSMKSTEWGMPPVVLFAVNDATGADAPATAVKNDIPTVRKRNSHTVCFIMRVIREISGDRPGERGYGYSGPVMIPDTALHYI
jgi:hypothetical protein